MTELPKIELWCHEGRSDKIYCVTVEESGGGYVVNFAYGRRGAALNTGTKTSAPVSHAEAVAIYLKLVESKIAKGYEAVGGSVLARADAGGTVATVPTVATVGTVLAESARIDTGLRPQLLNPIGEAEAEAYLSTPRWCVQEKYDGRRTLVRRTPEGGIVAANRKGQRIALSRAVESALGELPGAFVLDGELVGETYHVFDLLACADARVQLDGHTATVSVYLPRDGVACIALLPQKLEVRRAGGALSVRVTGAPDGDLRLVVSDVTGHELLSQPAGGGEHRIQLSEIEAGKTPACVKLLRNGQLVDAVGIGR